MAHLGKDGYSHIHYDGRQARTISVREAARFQSFPDGFVFNGSMNSAFKQIGNAVPPLMAYQIALALKRNHSGFHAVSKGAIRTHCRGVIDPWRTSSRPSSGGSI